MCNCQVSSSRIRHWFILFVLLSGVAGGQEVVPFPRMVIKTEKAIEWTFQTNAAGWTAGHDCVVSAVGGVLRIQSSGNDPYLFGPPVQIPGPMAARVRLRCAQGGDGQIFWATTEAPNFDEARSRHFHLIRDNQFHDYTVDLAEQGTLSQLRLDPAEAPGVIEVESIQLVRQTMHPLEIPTVCTDGPKVTLRLKNYSAGPIGFTTEPYEYPIGVGFTHFSVGQRIVKQFTIGAGATEEFSLVAPGQAPFRTGWLSVSAKDLPSLVMHFVVVDTNATADWARLESNGLVLRAARDGSGARIELGGRLVGVLAPLVNLGGHIPKMKLTENGHSLLWHGDGVALELSLDGDMIMAKMESAFPHEGPVLRVYGALEQGLFPGLEYLAEGEHSSSTLDIETPEHVRYSPDPMKVTMPLMAFVTDRVMAAMTWRDMSLQTAFATPNFLDGPEGHRASLRGTNIECAILIRPPAPMEDAILWAAQRNGLPPLPVSPRSREEEMKFCLTTLSGPPLKTAEGWGHCAEPTWARQFFADQASTVWRLSGQIPSLPRLVPGGGHIVNDAIYFVTGRAQEWLNMRAAGARSIMAEQKADGSFRYEGKFRRGHFEDTASGYCAVRAVALLEHARFTGEDASLQAGVKALEFMKHFQDPRGAQTWEVPLHTPDILASANLVHAYVRGYELTGQRDYLERARAWAITGLPFVYQWSNEPVMAYGTIAVFGATGWQAPNWMGRPVQWCGYDYAYALTMLAPLDKAMDWRRIATGIEITAEQMQYPSGPFAGCEPDSFNLASQDRNGPAINPSAIVSLRLALEGKLDSLAVASEGGHRVVAPFPVFIRDGKASIEGRAGVAYQVVVDGQRIVEINSLGEDTIPLAEK